LIAGVRPIVSMVMAKKKKFGSFPSLTVKLIQQSWHETGACICACVYLCVVGACICACVYNLRNVFNTMKPSALPETEGQLSGYVISMLHKCAGFELVYNDVPQKLDDEPTSRGRLIESEPEHPHPNPKP